jgi:hypothetical protein
VLPLVAVVAVVLVAMFAVYQIFDTNGSSDDPGQAVGDTPRVSASPQPSTTPSPSSAPPSASGQPQGNPGAVDKQAGLIVLNNTTIKGLASRTGEKLRGADWKVRTTGNLTPRNQVATTTVFYSDSDQEATAQAVVDQLGFGSISQSQQMARNGITVVLASDADSS